MPPKPPAVPHWHVLAHRLFRGQGTRLPARYATPHAARQQAQRLEARGGLTDYTVSAPCTRSHAP